MNLAMSDKTGQIIVKIGFGFIMLMVAWTVVASLVFLLGTGLLPDFPHPFYQWWLYALNFDGNARVALWLKIGAGVGVLPPLVMIFALIYRGQQVKGPKLRRPLFGGMVKPPLAVTDNHGHAVWLDVKTARKKFPGPTADYGGIVIGEAYRVDKDKVAKVDFDPQDRNTWGQGGKAPLLIDPCVKHQSHSLMIIGSGGYKTTTALSTLLYWTGSAVILDPAGEIAPMLRAARERMGHTIYELDPEGDVGFNALDWINIKKPLVSSDIDAVVTWVCGEVKETGDKNKDFFDSMGRKLITALMSHMLFDPAVPPRFKSLATVLDAVAMPPAKLRPLLYSIYENSPSAYARRLAGTVCGLVDETFSGIAGTAGELTSWLANDALAKLVSGNSFKTSDLLNGKVTIFLKMPMKILENTPGVARTVIGSLLNAAYEANGKFDGRILFLLDEAARLGYMKILETARDAGRKYGITMQLLYQNTGQIIDQWGEQGKNAWYGGVSFRCYASVQDLDTATELENTCGTYGVMASSEGTNTGTSGKGFETGNRSRGSNTSFHEVSRPLIRKSEIMQDMRDDDMIVLLRSSPPLRCGRAIYFRRPELNDQVGENKFYKKTKVLLPMKD
jgi:type IV secretion system protein VirD4